MRHCTTQLQISNATVTIELRPHHAIISICQTRRICDAVPMGISVLTVGQMRDWEKATWAAGQSEAAVIQLVGQRLAALARQLTRPGDTILFLAGQGHNGDDARAAARSLEGRHAELLEVLQPDTALPPLERQLAENPALIVDGLFGTGLNRPLSEAWQKIINAINATDLPVLAVDVPSGLNADTGASFGAVINASVTLTIGAPKTGLLTPAGTDAAGRLEVATDVGLIPCPVHSELRVSLPADFARYPGPRQVTSHKGTFGHVVVIAGSLGYHGAAVLAARGALRAQPGLVTVLTQPDAYVPVAAQLAAAMVQICPPNYNAPDTVQAVLAGPGLADPALPADVRMSIRRLWRINQHPLVVDASGLDMLAPEPFPKDALRVLTPHPGEAARLLRCSPATIQADRVGSLRDISRRYGGCWVVLKGHHTLIGRSEGDIFLNPTGNPWLAQGGSGDLLGGFIAGLLAQPALQADPVKALRYAVWAHGAAADRLQATRANWTTEDLASEIGHVR